MTEAGGAPQLSGEEKTRYARHITLPEVGVEGQQRLKAASVLCIGAGGLGSPLLLYLAAAGVGRIGVVDDDGYEWVDHGGESWYRMSPIDTWKIYVDESGEADD
jgi:adenylyltransferase/sulfurtransferase